MKINSDFKDLLRDFNTAGVRYLIVSGYAVMVYMEPRYTKDLDLWVEPVEVNAEAWERKAIVDFGGVSAPVLCREDLLSAKLATGRAQDKRDARKLARRT